ncbi:MAG: tetratricopeptide repeat protein [Dehalococcoidia bacterium]
MSATKLLITIVVACILMWIYIIVDTAGYQDEDYAEGLDAYQNQDYETALTIFTTLAENGYIEGELYLKLGIIYSMGTHLEDKKDAMKWWRLAAEQDNALGKYFIGQYYEDGWGVPQNKVYAHMWYNLSHAQGFGSGDYSRDRIAEEMTVTEITAAEQLAVECVAKEFKGC